jgi:hypothetical protein
MSLGRFAASLPFCFRIAVSEVNSPMNHSWQGTLWAAITSVSVLPPEYGSKTELQELS